MNFDKYISPLSEEKLLQACAKIKHVALDMDGTIYLGSTLFPYTQAFLQTLRDNGISYSFLTNNPTKSSNDYLLKLQKLGIDATEEQMYTSSIATIDYIHMQYPEAKRIFTLGTPSMQAEFKKAGFEITSDSANDVPDILVVAFDTTLEYSRLCRAAWLQRQTFHILQPIPIGCVLPTSPPYWSTVAHCVRLSKGQQSVSPTLLSVSLTPICFIAFAINTT